MKTAKEIKSELDTLLSQEGLYLRVPSIDEKELKKWNRAKTRWIKDRNILEKRLQFLELPNAEVSLKGMKRDILHRIEVIDDRWEKHGDSYMVKGIKRDDYKKLKAHHHAQYDYNKLVKQLQEVTYLLD